METIIVQKIKAEIEEMLKCEVLAIAILEAEEPFVRIVVRFNADEIRDPFEKLPCHHVIEHLHFKEKLMTFVSPLFRFEFYKQKSKWN
jgi:hypothetical protein